MDSGRDKARSFFGFFAAILVVFVVAAPIASAVEQVIAQIRDSDGDRLEITGTGAAKIAGKVTGNVTSKIRSSQNDLISAEDEGATCTTHPTSGCFGLTPVEAHQGAVNTRIYPGGGGLLGAGSCLPPAGNNTSVIPADSIITGVLVTADAVDDRVSLKMSAAALGGATVANLRTTPEQPYATLPLDTGLGTTSNVTFTCTGGVLDTDAGTEGNQADPGNFLIFGTSNTVTPLGG